MKNVSNKFIIVAVFTFTTSIALFSKTALSTTGYEFIIKINSLLVSFIGSAESHCFNQLDKKTEIYKKFSGATKDFDSEEMQNKKMKYLRSANRKEGFIKASDREDADALIKKLSNIDLPDEVDNYFGDDIINITKISHELNRAMLCSSVISERDATSYLTALHQFPELQNYNTGSTSDLTEPDEDSLTTALIDNVFPLNDETTEIFASLKRLVDANKLLLSEENQEKIRSGLIQIYQNLQ